MLLGLSFVIHTGCGKSESSVVQFVSGEVNYDGKPAEGVQVYFIPISHVLPAGAISNPHGITGPDGRFKLTTLQPDDGAPVGRYQVVLLWPEQSSEEVESSQDRLQGWYDARHSRLEATVKPESNSLPPFKLPAVKGPPPVSEGVPGRN
jgi:hypothetical protein